MSDRESARRQLTQRLVQQMREKQGTFEAPRPLQLDPESSAFKHTRDSAWSYAVAHGEQGEQGGTASASSSYRPERCVMHSHTQRRLCALACTLPPTPNFSMVPRPRILSPPRCACLARVNAYRPRSSPEITTKERRSSDRVAHTMRMDRGLDSTPLGKQLFPYPHENTSHTARDGAAEAAGRAPAWFEKMYTPHEPVLTAPPARGHVSAQPKQQAQQEHTIRTPIRPVTPSMGAGMFSPPQASPPPAKPPAKQAVGSPLPLRASPPPAPLPAPGSSKQRPPITEASYAEPLTPGQQALGPPPSGLSVYEPPPVSHDDSYTASSKVDTIRRKHAKLKELERELSTFDVIVANERAKLLEQFDEGKREAKEDLLFEKERLLAELALTSARFPSEAIPEPEPVHVDPDLLAAIAESYRDRVVSEGITGALMGTPISTEAAEQRGVSDHRAALKRGANGGSPAAAGPKTRAAVELWSR